MAINDDIDRQTIDWIRFDEMIAQVAAANGIDIPRLQYWLHMKQFCLVRPFRFWHPHIEYQQFFPNVRDPLFAEGTVLVGFLLGSDCFPDESTLWALRNGGAVLWQKSVVAQWLLKLDANVPESWLVADASHSPIKASAPIDDQWVTKAEILKHQWPLPPGDKIPPLEKILDDLPQWVSEACKKVGRPGYGAKSSHLWNPAMLAICLMATSSRKRWYASKAALDRFIRSDFPDSVSEWERRCELL